MEKQTIGSLPMRALCSQQRICICGLQVVLSAAGKCAAASQSQVPVHGFILADN